MSCLSTIEMGNIPTLRVHQNMLHKMKMEAHLTCCIGPLAWNRICRLSNSARTQPPQASCSDEPPSESLALDSTASQPRASSTHRRPAPRLEPIQSHISERIMHCKNQKGDRLLLSSTSPCSQCADKYYDLFEFCCFSCVM